MAGIYIHVPFCKQKCTYCDFASFPREIGKAEAYFACLLKEIDSRSVELKDMINRMQHNFGTKVQAIGNDKKGRIYIDYYTRDDLDRIVEILDLIEKHKK